MTPQTKGITFILISALSFGTYGIWSRLMADSFGEFSQAWTRGLFLLSLILILNLKFKFFKPIKRQDFKWFAFIALAGLNQAPYFFGFRYLDIGTATLLFYAALVVGGYLIGKLVFAERFTSVKIISLVLAFLGMLSIYQLTLTPAQFLPATLTIMAGLMGAIGAVLPKKLSGDYPELQIMSSYFIVMVLGNGLISLIIKDPLPGLALHSLGEGGWLAWLAYAFALLIANFTVIEGFKYLEASIGSLIGLAEIIFGILFGVLFFAEIIGLGTLIGATLIILSAALPNIASAKLGLPNLSLNKK
jgi:drug/metabolite transporter (DMT)-like permease